MPGVVFVIGFALLAFAYDLCAQGCALPFRFSPLARHIGYLTVFPLREFFLNAIGSVPVRGRTTYCATMLCHCLHVITFYFAAFTAFFGPFSQFPTISGTLSSPYRRYCSSTQLGQIVDTARARESFMFVYCAIGSGFDTARAQTLCYSSSTLSGLASPLPVRGRMLLGLASPLPVRGKA
ncbi:hypothetical protein EDB84DRAFT_1580740, partial [Lactarius hengduanensis]